MLDRGHLTLDSGRELRVEVVRQSADGSTMLVREVRDEPTGRGLTPIEQSDALTRAERRTPRATAQPVLAPEASRAVAVAIATAEIPLPPGLNTAAALDWPGQSGFGPITVADVRDLLEVNAARDWIWFAAHNDLTPEQRLILSEVPRWPRLRDSGLGASFAAAIDRILDGDSDEWVQEFAARQFPEWNGRPPRTPGW